MGVVYLAERRSRSPQGRPQDIKPGMDTEQVMARFEAERQALAIMDHPTLPACSTPAPPRPAGPYFVMELVKGVPITDYCDTVQFDPERATRAFRSGLSGDPARRTKRESFIAT